MNLTILSSRIFTGDSSRPWTEAVSIQDNHIVAIGTNDEVKSLSPGDAEILELPGRLVTPGFVDAHTHFLTYGMTLQWINLRGLISLKACRQRIKEAVADRQPGEWIIGRGWNHFLWEEGREPTHQDLDDLTPHNPAMMVRVCGNHMVWVNSLALEKAGITKNTPDPEGGRIEREPDTGEPTGLLRGAEHLILEHIPPTSLEKHKETALAAQANLLSLGITGIRSMEKLESWEALDALDKEGKLKLRIYHLLPPDEVEEAFSRGIKPGQGTDRLWFGQVKLFADGSLGSDTALLHEPYLHQPENHGLAYLTREELQKNIEFAYSHGCDVAIHAIGDKGVSNALESIAAARQTYPGERRDSIEHVQLLRPQDFALFSEMGITASIQPSFVATDWEMAMKKWGPERCQNAYTFKTFLQKGIPVQFSSDMPVELSSPIWGLQAAVTRQNSEGEPSGGWFPEQKLTLEESITGYTSQHAWVTRKEKDRGSLSPGKWADLTIFSQDLFKLDPKEWPAVEVEMTIIDGEIVYQKGQ